MLVCVCKSLRTRTRPGSCKAGGWQENPGRRVSVEKEEEPRQGLGSGGPGGV